MKKPRQLRAPLTLKWTFLTVAAAMLLSRVNVTAAENARQIIVKAVLLSLDDAKLRMSEIPWNKTDTAQTGVRTALVDRDDVTPLVERLRAAGGKVLSEPTLMTLDGQEATVQIGGEIATRASWTDEESGLRGSHARLGFLKFGTSLTATPSLLSASRVLLALCIEHGVPVGNAEDEDEKSIPAVIGSKLSTEVVCKPRQAVVLSVPNFRASAEKKMPASSLVAFVTVEPLEHAVSEEPTSGEVVAALRDEVRDLRRQLARLSEQMATRAVPLPAPPRTVERALAAEPVEWALPVKERLVTKVYAVADLVVPVPDVRAVTKMPQPTKPAKEPAIRAEFAPLINLITSTIEPGTWEKRGGAGAIHAFETNLSLVISQTAAVHEQIAEFLDMVRRQQDHVLELETTLVSATLEAAEKVGVDLVESGRTLSAERAKRALEAFQVARETRIVAAPRVTVFNKQLFEMETQISENRNLHLVMCGAMGESFETVRLNLAVNPKDAADAVRGGISVELRPGETHVLDVTDRIGASEREVGVPLNKIPHVERLFKNVRPASSERLLLLISPKVCYQPEALNKN